MLHRRSRTRPRSRLRPGQERQERQKRPSQRQGQRPGKGERSWQSLQTWQPQQEAFDRQPCDTSRQGLQAPNRPTRVRHQRNFVPVNTAIPPKHRHYHIHRIETRISAEHSQGRLVDSPPSADLRKAGPHPAPAHSCRSCVSYCTPSIDSVQGYKSCQQTLSEAHKGMLLRE